MNVQAVDIRLQAEYVQRHGLHEPLRGRGAPALAGRGVAVAGLVAEVGVEQHVRLALGGRVGLIPRNDLPDVALHARRVAQHRVHGQPPRHRVQVDTAVLVHARALLGDGADAVVDMRVRRPAYARAQRRFQQPVRAFHGRLHARLIVQIGEHRPQLRNQEDFALLVFTRADVAPLVVDGGQIPFAVPAARVHGAVHLLQNRFERVRVRVVPGQARDAYEHLARANPRDGQPHAFALAAETRAVHAVVPVAAPDAHKPVRAGEAGEELHAPARVFVHGAHRAVVEGHDLVQERKVARLAQNRVQREGDPHGAVGEVVVADAAADERARRVAVFILIGQDAPEPRARQLRVEAGQALGVAGHVAIAVVAHARPAAAHAGGVLVEAVERVVQARVRRGDRKAGNLLRALFANGGKQPLGTCGHRANRRQVGKRSLRADHDGERLFLAGLQIGVNVQRQTELFAQHLFAAKPALFLQRLGAQLVSVHADKRVAPCAEARRLRVGQHISVHRRGIVGFIRLKEMPPHRAVRRVEIAVVGVVRLRAVRIVRVGVDEGNQRKPRRLLALIDRAHAPEFAPSLLGHEERELRAHAVLHGGEHGIAQPVTALVCVERVAHRQAVGGRPRARIAVHHIQHAILHKRNAPPQTVLREALAEAHLRKEGDVFVVVHIVMPVPRRFAAGYHKLPAAIFKVSVFHGNVPPMHALDSSFLL